MPKGSRQSEKTHCPQGHCYATDGILQAKKSGRFGRICKPCKLMRARVRNAKLSAAGRGRKKENRDADWEATLVKKFGITAAEYYSMLSVVPGCAICGLTPEQNGRRLAVDHDHVTGRVRGLLCNACNTGIGHLKDGRLFKSALEYLGG